MLETYTFGAPTGVPPLLIAHGLYGSARNWGAIARRLADSRQVVTVDMRNHGQSRWFATHSYHDLADDLARVIAENGGRMDVLGHSMGGKAAMVLAVEYATAVNSLVVGDIAPVAYGHTQIHLIEAMRELQLEGIESRSDADQKLAGRVADPATRAFLLQSLDIKAREWRLNHEVLATEMDRIIGFPELDGQFTGASLFLSGSLSDYVKPEHRGAILALFPQARFARLKGAGHWLHAEKPRDFEAAVRSFLNA